MKQFINKLHFIVPNLNLFTVQLLEIWQVCHVPVRCWNSRLDERLLQLVRHVVAGRQPVVVRLELRGHHAKAEVLVSTQAVQVQIADLSLKEWKKTCLIILQLIDSTNCGNSKPRRTVQTFSLRGAERSAAVHNP